MSHPFFSPESESAARLSDADLWEHFVDLGLSEEDASLHVERRRAGKAERLAGPRRDEAEDTPSGLMSAAASFLHGGGLGTGELAAGVGGMIGGSEGFGAGVKINPAGFGQGAQRYRDDLEGLQAANPNISAASELVGMVGLPGAQVGRAAVGGVKAGVPLGTRGVLSILGRGAAAGSVPGAVQGFATGGADPEDMGARLEGGGTGAVLGALAGAGGAGLMSILVRKAAERAADLTARGQARVNVGKRGKLLDAQIARERGRALQGREHVAGDPLSDIQQAAHDYRAGRISAEDMQTAREMARTSMEADLPASQPEVATPIAGTEGRGFEVQGTRATPPVPTTPTLAEMQQGMTPRNMAPDDVMRSLVGAGKSPKVGQFAPGGGRYVKAGKYQKAGPPVRTRSPRAPSDIPAGQETVIAKFLEGATPEDIPARLEAMRAVGIRVPAEVEAELLAAAQQGAKVGASPARGSLPRVNLADESGRIGAYHGSPHKFEAFSMEKIGTGEGAQAYGHGLYFAENPEVAKGYRLLAEPSYRGSYVRTLAKDAMDKAQAKGLTGNEARQAAIRDLTERAQRPGLPASARQHLNDAVNNFDDVLKPSSGATYRVEIDAEPHELLDWDKPLSQQSEPVRAFFRGVSRADPPPWKAVQVTAADVAASRYPNAKAGEWIARQDDPIFGHTWNGSTFNSEQAAAKNAATRNAIPKSADPHGESLYRQLGTSQQAAERLRAAGIKGIRYLDQGSRAAGKGTNNYVIFDDKIVRIIDKESGRGGGAILGGIAAAGGLGAIGNIALHRKKQGVAK